MADMICTRSECVDKTRSCGDCEFYQEMCRPIEIKEPWTRKRVLKEAERCVCGGREHDYGSPEDSFKMIAGLWTVYLRGCGVIIDSVDLLESHDVAAMLALLKIARLSANPQHMDSWVDLAGYAACGGEIAGKEAQE